MELSGEMNEVRLAAKVYVCVRTELGTAAEAESLSPVLRKSAKTEMKDNPFLFFLAYFNWPFQFSGAPPTIKLLAPLGCYNSHARVFNGVTTEAMNTI